MEMITGNSVGVDYHQDSLQVTVMDASGRRLTNRHLPNDVEEFVRVVAQYGTVKAVALEAGTGSASFADAVLQRTGWMVKQCHPGYVRRMKLNPDKSDKSDAELICDLGRVGYLPVVAIYCHFGVRGSLSPAQKNRHQPARRITWNVVRISGCKKGGLLS